MVMSELITDEERRGAVRFPRGCVPNPSYSGSLNSEPIPNPSYNGSLSADLAPNPSYSGSMSGAGPSALTLNSAYSEGSLASGLSGLVTSEKPLISRPSRPGLEIVVEAADTEETTGELTIPFPSRPPPQDPNIRPSRKPPLPPTSKGKERVSSYRNPKFVPVSDGAGSGDTSNDEIETCFTHK